ncbi:MAG: purine-binding chemotaxis protein CheW [Anaerolineae bacterium]|nr:purine-binding chemotaxis protein CheW [Anaerolineae bacterium]
MDTTAEEALSERQNVVAFRLDKQTYALPIEPIAQIIEMVAVTPIPQLDAVVEGVINVHGEAVAVVKLRRHFGLSDAPLQLNTPILLMRISGQTIGLIVDEVTDVFNLPTDQIVQLGEILPEELGNAPIFRGLTYVADDAVLMLDPDQLFRPDQLEILARAADMLQKAIAEKGRVEPAAEAEAEPKPIRRRRRATPKKKAAPEETSAEPEPKAKTTRRRRKNKPTRGNA